MNHNKLSILLLIAIIILQASSKCFDYCYAQQSTQGRCTNCYNDCEFSTQASFLSCSIQPTLIDQEQELTESMCLSQCYPENKLQLTSEPYIQESIHSPTFQQIIQPTVEQISEPYLQQPSYPFSGQTEELTTEDIEQPILYQSQEQFNQQSQQPIYDQINDQFNGQNTEEYIYQETPEELTFESTSENLESQQIPGDFIEQTPEQFTIEQNQEELTLGQGAQQQKRSQISGEQIFGQTPEGQTTKQTSQQPQQSTQEEFVAITFEELQKLKRETEGWTPPKQRLLKIFFSMFGGSLIFIVVFTQVWRCLDKRRKLRQVQNKQGKQWVKMYDKLQTSDTTIIAFEGKQAQSLKGDQSE